MAMRVLQQILLDIKSDRNILNIRSRFVHYVSNVSIHNVNGNRLCNNNVLVRYYCNESKILKTPRISLNRQMHTKLFEGSLLCNNKTALARRISINRYPIAVYNIRHYTNASPVMVNEAITYNTGLFQLISESLPVELATEAFRLIHYQIGLPWWLTIIFTTVIARTLIHFPLTILDLQTRARQQNLKGELQEVAKRINMEVQMGIQTSEITRSQAALHFRRAMAREQKEMFLRENCHPFKSIAIILVQAPVWISLSVAVRNMCFMLPYRNSATLQDYHGFVDGGFGWMQNLTQVDPMFVLPIVFGFSGLTILEVNEVLFNIRNSKFRRILKNVFRGFTICFVPITACIPSSLTLYWVTNNCCALIQNTILLSPKVRRLVRIKKTDSEVQHPYAELANRILGKFQSKKLSGVDVKLK